MQIRLGYLSAAAGACLCSFLSAYAQQSGWDSPAPQSPAPEPGPPAPSTLPPPGGPEQEPGERISLGDAIRQALENNLNIDVARTTPLIADERVRAAEGAFDPVLFGDTNYNDDLLPTANQFQILFGGGLQTKTEVYDLESGLRGILPFGLQYTSSYRFLRTESSSSFFSLEPQYDSGWVTELTLPLLRGLIDNQASVLVKRSRIARDISEEGFRRNLTDLITGVEASYWGLSAARSEARVAEKSLQRARDLVEQATIQFDVGVVSKLAVTQAQAGLAAREFDVITTRNVVERDEDALRAAMRAPSYEGYRTAPLIPDDPQFTEYRVDEATAIEKALALRPELREAEGLLDEADLLVGQAENERLPQLDVVGRYGFAGLAGDVKPVELRPGELPTDQSFIDRQAAAAALSGLIRHNPSGVYDQWFRSEGSRSWGVGAEFSVPLGNRTASANLASRRIEYRRARTDYARVKQDVILDVRAAVRDLDSAVEGYRAAERNYEASAEQLRAEEERLRLGDSTPFLVLEVEEDLVTAERQRIFALRVLQVAITRIERAQGTLLETRGIAVEEQLEREPIYGPPEEETPP